MPFEIADQRGGSLPSHFFEDDSLLVERQIGCWKSNTMSTQQDGIIPMPGSNFAASSTLERLSQRGVPSADCLLSLPSTIARDHKDKLQIGGDGGSASISETSWNSNNNHPRSRLNLSAYPASYGLDGPRAGTNGTQFESSLFSSSLSEIFSRKLRLFGKEVLSHQPVKAVTSYHEEEEPCELLDEIEAHTIGHILPDEDDLFSGVIDPLGHNPQVNSGDDLEDIDLFSSGGGMQLDVDEDVSAGQFIGGVFNAQGHFNGSVVGERPSRTLFVRNINSNVEDSELKALFEQYGDIRTLYTASKHRGFVMISYYDIRAARNAMKALQNKLLMCRKLDIHYSIPKDTPSEKNVNQGVLVVSNLDSSVSDDQLLQIFGVYGDIKEIRETPHRFHDKFIEYYDIRAVGAAFNSLNGSDIAGKQIKLEPRNLWCTKWSPIQQTEPERDELQWPFEKLQSDHVVTNPHLSSSVPKSLSSPLTVSSISKQAGLHEPHHSVNDVKFGSQYVPSLYPHSLPVYHDTLANGSSYGSLSSIRDMGSSGDPRVTEGFGNKCINGVNLNGQLMEFNGGVFGSSGKGSCTTHGHHFMWNGSSSPQQHPSSPMIWSNSRSNSPSFVNGVQSHHFPHVPGFHRAPPLMLNTASPIHHHIGSAPAVNPSFLERQHGYIAESPEASGFQLGSLRNGGFPIGSPSHPAEIASHNIFSHVGGNYMELNNNGALHSPQQMLHIFPRRNPMISGPASFDPSNERARNFSHRRNELNSNHADKKQYELNVDRILHGDDCRTTLMIKNIPNKYTSKMLLTAIDEHCRGTYDFLYLPIDFKNKCNVGYAFINMIDPQQIIPFFQAFNGKKWEKFNSEKVASLAYARIQGKGALVAHFQNSSLMNEDKRCRPILFHTDGPNAGDQEPFPMGTNILSRPGKPRTGGTDENHKQGSPQNYADGEGSSKAVESSSGSSEISN
ncbi:protein MEI2-like 1 isoform X2 [Tripterygium wilfordii]|uniref:protein MEI2-like 1 isoform X2 n=1 Tax=Tripterygium wilfordii TaxID=458696 RepID=UPI0018F85A65|nr:protein MEI2-like 1 isoform X2 [Tripterygium wilfordii]